jgi:hypothetical protein
MKETAMNHAASLTLAALLAGTALTGMAGVDEPTAIAERAGARPGTALDDEQVRPLDRSRKPIPAIEHDVVRPEPKRPKQTRSADDEFVRPGGAVFQPERALDDVFAAPKAPGKPRVRASPASLAPHAGQPNRRELAEDPAGRASESGRPAREGRREP